MSPRVPGLLADIDAVYAVDGYLELDPDQALDGVVLALEGAAAIGVDLSASDVRALLAMLQDYRALYAQRLDLDSRMDAAVRALLLELRHPCPTS